MTVKKRLIGALLAMTLALGVVSSVGATYDGSEVTLTYSCAGNQLTDICYVRMNDSHTIRETTKDDLDTLVQQVFEDYDKVTLIRLWW